MLVPESLWVGIIYVILPSYHLLCSYSPTLDRPFPSQFPVYIIFSFAATHRQWLRQHGLYSSYQLHALYFIHKFNIIIISFLHRIQRPSSNGWAQTLTNKACSLLIHCMLIRGAYYTRNITMDGRLSHISGTSNGYTGSMQKCNGPTHVWWATWWSGWFPYYMPMTGRHNPNEK